ncbi:MAG: hypothetical protein AAGI23_10935 [Bacteroidota bacterium]
MPAKLPILFWVILTLFVAHQLLQYIIGASIPYVDSYFDPFACAVLGLSIFLWERNVLWKANQQQLGIGETIIATLTLAVVSEEVFPLLSDRFYRDPMDYLAFVVGGLFYWLTTSISYGKSR